MAHLTTEEKEKQWKAHLDKQYEDHEKYGRNLSDKRSIDTADQGPDIDALLNGNKVKGNPLAEAVALKKAREEAAKKAEKKAKKERKEKKEKKSKKKDRDGNPASPRRRTKKDKNLAGSADATSMELSFDDDADLSLPFGGKLSVDDPTDTPPEATLDANADVSVEEEASLEDVEEEEEEAPEPPPDWVVERVEHILNIGSINGMLVALLTTKYKSIYKEAFPANGIDETRGILDRIPTIELIKNGTIVRFKKTDSAAPSEVDANVSVQSSEPEMVSGSSTPAPETLTPWEAQQVTGGTMRGCESLEQDFM